MADYLRAREGRGRRGGAEALRTLLCKHVAVPGDFATLQEAVAGGGSESHLTLHITLGEGTHILTAPLRPPRAARIVIRSALLPRSAEVGGGVRPAAGSGGRGRRRRRLGTVDIILPYCRYQW